MISWFDCNDSGYFVMFIWEELVDMREHTWYLFSEIPIKHYDGNKLQATPGSIVEKLKLDRAVDLTIIPEELLISGDAVEPRPSRNCTITCNDIARGLFSSTNQIVSRYRRSIEIAINCHTSLPE